MTNKKILWVSSLLTLGMILAGCNNPEESSVPSSGSGTSSVTSDSAPVTTSDVPVSSVTDNDITGDGTASNPYLLGNKIQLQKFAELAGGIGSSACFALTADIDFGGDEWTPVGTTAVPFAGVFLGNGHAIRNFKISEFASGKDSYGFFGYTKGSVISGVSFEDITVSLNVFGSGSSLAVGGVVGYGVNTYIDRVEVSFAQYSVKSLQNGTSYLYSGGLAGYLSTESVGETSYFIDVLYCSVTGDLKIDMSDAADTMNALGGIAGIIDTGYYEGIYSINSSYFSGNLEGGTYVGGITGYLSMLTSVVDSYAVGEHVTAADTTGAYAGGIAAYAGYETAILNTFAGFAEISAPVSTSSYASYAGATCAIYAKDGYSENYAIRGMASYHNYVLKNVSVAADITETGTETVVDADLFTARLGYTTDVWNFTDTYPSLNESIESYQISVTLDANDESGTSETVTVSAGDYDSSLATKVISADLKRESYSFYGYCYDAEGTVEYRWYAPLNHDTSLYAGWADISALVGSYSYECVYYENVVGTGSWKFDQDYFYWISSDFSVFKYEYYFNGEYIFIGDGVVGPMGIFIGGYENCILKYENGKVIAYDVNDEDAVYTGTKVSTDLVIPDYSDQTYLGKWYSKSVSVNLYADGNASSASISGSATYYGGFNVSGNEIQISVWGKISGTYRYDAEHDIMIKDGDLLAREAIEALYTTSDNSLMIGVTASKTYVIENGSCTSSVITGTLADGETISVGNAEYTISGSVLTKVSGEDPVDPNPVDPDPVTANFYGTWSGKLGLNTATIVLNSDGTGIYGDTAFTYTVSGNEITTDICISMTFDPDTMSLSVVYDDGEYSFSGTFTDYTPAASSSTDITMESVAGTYSGVWGGTRGTSACTLILNADGTGSFANTYDTIFTFQWSVDDQGVITVTDFVDSTYCYENLRLTYDSASDSISGLVYENDMVMADYTITVSR